MSWIYSEHFNLLSFPLQQTYIFIAKYLSFWKTVREKSSVFNRPAVWKRLPTPALDSVSLLWGNLQAKVGRKILGQLFFFCNLTLRFKKLEVHFLCSSYSGRIFHNMYCTQCTAYCSNYANLLLKHRVRGQKVYTYRDDNPDKKKNANETQKGTLYWYSYIARRSKLMVHMHNWKNFLDCGLANLLFLSVKTHSR